MKLRSCSAVFATALLALTAAAPAAKAAREPLNAYRVAPTAENKQKLALAGYDMTEADHGSYLEVYGTTKQASGLTAQGLAPKLVGKGNQATSQAYQQYAYRYYGANNTYLGVSELDLNVYYMGPLSSNGLLDAGPARNWMVTSGCMATT